MDFNDWLANLPGGSTRKQLGEMAGIDPSTLYRQIERGGLKMETVRDLSRATGAKAVTELIRTGHLDPTDLDGANTQAALRQASIPELIDELFARAADPDVRDQLNAVGADNNPVGAAGNIVPLPTREQTAQAENGRPYTDADISQAIHEGNYAADTTPTEPLEGDDDYHDGP